MKTENQNIHSKLRYTKPEVEIIEIDMQINLVMESTPINGPEEGSSFYRNEKNGTEMC
jgi:hypothetical protein